MAAFAAEPLEDFLSENIKASRHGAGVSSYIIYKLRSLVTEPRQSLKNSGSKSTANALDHKQGNQRRWRLSIPRHRFVHLRLHDSAGRGEARNRTSFNLWPLLTWLMDVDSAASSRLIDFCQEPKSMIVWVSSIRADPLEPDVSMEMILLRPRITSFGIRMALDSCERVACQLTSLIC